MRFHGLLVLVLVVSVSAAAQFRPSLPNAQPAKNTVREYCRLDYMGGRLAHDTWIRMQPLTTWKDNPDWHSVTVVSRYDMGDSSESIHSARISVHYQVIGRFAPGIGFTPDAASEDVDFRVKEVDGDWLIDSADPLVPHVSRQRVIQWLQAALAREKDPGNRAAAEQALRHLQEKPAPAQP
jgi:hypothetical protein